MKKSFEKIFFCLWNDRLVYYIATFDFLLDTIHPICTKCYFAASGSICVGKTQSQSEVIPLRVNGASPQGWRALAWVEVSPHPLRPWSLPMLVTEDDGKALPIQTTFCIALDRYRHKRGFLIELPFVHNNLLVIPRMDSLSAWPLNVYLFLPSSLRGG